MQALADVSWQLITNPNIAFVLLVLGLWSAVLAIATPGTGLPETAAVICLALATVGLFNLPTSLVGLALILLSMGLFVAEVQLPSHGALLVAGAIIMGLGGLLLFPSTGRSADQLSWVTIIATPLVSTAVFGFLLSLGLAAQGRPALQDLRHLIGARGITRTEVGRQGTVYVGGEDWSATAESKIPPDTDVVVVERSGLRLKVAPASPANTSGASNHPSAGPA